MVLSRGKDIRIHRIQAGVVMSDNVRHTNDILDCMMARLHIDHLYWDEWNRHHIAKHQVLPEEAEEIAASDPVVRETYKQRFQLLGPTLSGRMLSVVVGAVPNQAGVFYVFSARPASRSERRYYDQQKGGSLP
jgi:uncharacterized DUF497 family protein